MDKIRKTEEEVYKELERLGIPQDPKERTFEEQQTFQKLERPTENWLQSVSRYNGSSSLIHAEDEVYRVTVEKLSEGEKQ